MPDYARPLEGPFGRALRLGVERALTRFVDEVEAGGAAEGGPLRHLRRPRAAPSSAPAGRSTRSWPPTASARAWPGSASAPPARRPGSRPATLYDLAGAIFSYIDAISAESVAGFTQEQEHVAGERQRRRRALALLLARDDVPAAEVDDVAALAGWRRAGARRRRSWPAAPRGRADADRLAARLGPEAVAAVDDGLVVAFLADPDAPGRRAQVAAAVTGRPAALGPAVALEGATRSLAARPRRARAARGGPAARRAG